MRVTVLVRLFTGVTRKTRLRPARACGTAACQAGVACTVLGSGSCRELVRLSCELVCGGITAQDVANGPTPSVPACARRPLLSRWLPFAGLPCFVGTNDGNALVKRWLSMWGETEVELRWTGRRKLCAPGLGVNNYCRPQARYLLVCQAPYAKGVCRFFLFRRKKSTIGPMLFHFYFIFFFLRSASHLCFSNGTAGIS